MIKPRIKV
ncbi:MAG: hypothetical protein EZS28_024532, partial [Streblomastix strix]